MALYPAVPGHHSRSERWAFEWEWLPTKGTVPKGELISAAGDESFGERWWFVFKAGLYFSPDGNTTLTKVLDKKGNLVN
jgi:hypothetical protein